MAKRKLTPGEAWAVRVSERSGRAAADLVLLVMSVGPRTSMYGGDVTCLTLESSDATVYPEGAVRTWSDGAFTAPNRRLA